MIVAGICPALTPTASGSFPTPVRDSWGIGDSDQPRPTTGLTWVLPIGRFGRYDSRSREDSSSPHDCPGDGAAARIAVRAASVAMTEIGDSEFHKGQPVWVIGPDGSQRAAEYVGEGETSAWFGGPPRVFVVYVDTRAGEAVEVERVIPRDA